MKLYEGKAKVLYKTENPQELLVVYSDQVTAFNGEKKEQIVGKGQLNNQISSLIFKWLNAQGVKTQFIRQVDQKSQIVEALTMIPIEVVVRNIVAGSLAKRFGIDEGQRLNKPILEYFYKNDHLGDPFVNESQLEALGILNLDQSKIIQEQALFINEKLVELFNQIDIDLVDLKFEFGLTDDGKIILADEVSPDTCRLWEKESQRKLDKDNYRREITDLIPIYTEVFERLNKIIK